MADTNTRIIISAVDQTAAGLNSVRMGLSGVATAAAAVGVSLSAVGMVALVRSSIDAADKLNDLTKVTNLTAEQLSGIGYAAKQSGSDLDGVANSISKLAENMGKNAEKFAQLGITAKDPIEAFKQLADVYNGIEDPQKQAAFAAEALGKSWKSAAPLLSEGSDRIGELAEKGRLMAGNINELTAQSDSFNDSISTLGAILDGKVNNVVGDLLPLLQLMATTMEDSASKSAALNNGFSPLTETLRVLMVLGGNVSFVLKAVGNDLGGMAAQVNALAHGDFQAVSEIHKQMVQDAESNRAAFDKWESAVMSAGATATATASAVASSVKTSASAVDQFIGVTNEAMKKQEAAEEAAKKRRAKARADAVQAQQEWMSGIGKTTEQLIEEANAAEYNNSLIGKTAVEIAILTSARYDEQIAAAEAQAVILQNNPSRKAELDLITMQIDALKRLQKAKGSEPILQANEQSAKDAAEEVKKLSESLNSGLTGAITRSFSTGSNLAQNFADTVQSIFSDLVLQPVVKAMFTSGLGAVGLGATGSALAGTAGGAAAGTAAGAVAGGSSIGSMAAAVAPYAIAAVGVYALAKYGFGWGNTRENVGDQRLVGQFNRSGFSGNYQQDWKVDGGWFGSDQRGTDITAINSAQGRAFKATVDGLQSTFNGLGVAIGDTSLRTRDWKVNVNQAGDVTGTLADSMGMQLIPSLEKFQLTGESLAQTAQRLTGVFQGTSYFITALGLDSQQAFGAFGIQSAAQRDALIKSFSGDTFDKQTADFNSKVSGFVQNFLTAADQLNPSLDAVGRTFSELKITGISTNQQFADRVKLELQAGNTDTVARLLNVADAFNTITASAEKSRAELAALVNANSFSTLADFQRAQAYAAQGKPFNLPQYAATGGVSTSGNTASIIASATASGGVALANDEMANIIQNAKDANIKAKAEALAALNAVKAIPTRNGSYYGDGGRATMAGYDAKAAEWNAGHAAQVAKLQATYDSLPAFASGGDHAGGFRWVGERGCELEYTGPSRIFSNSQSQSLLDTSGLLEEVKQMRAQLKSLVENQVRDNSAIKTAVQATADLLDRNTGGGGPMLVTTA